MLTFFSIDHCVNISQNMVIISICCALGSGKNSERERRKNLLHDVFNHEAALKRRGEAKGTAKMYVYIL